MNRYQEALKGVIERSNIINNCCSHISKCLKSGECEFNDVKLMCEDYICFKTLQELVQKATPKKVLDVYDTYFDIYLFGRCPTCLKNVNSGMNGCPYCLQALDWSVKDD